MNSHVHILNPVLSPVGLMNLQNKQGIQEKVNLATKIGVHSQILRHKSSSEGQILSRQASDTSENAYSKARCCSQTPRGSARELCRDFQRPRSSPKTCEGPFRSLLRTFQSSARASQEASRAVSKILDREGLGRNPAGVPKRGSEGPSRALPPRPRSPP